MNEQVGPQLVFVVSAIADCEGRTTKVLCAVPSREVAVRIVQHSERWQREHGYKYQRGDENYLIRTMPFYSSMEEFDSSDPVAERARIMEKLTPYEQRMLGLVT